MYQQYRKVKDKFYTLVSLSKNRDDVNEEIIKEQTEKGLTIDEILAQFIFEDWRAGDILIVGYSTIVNPILEEGELREATKLEKVLNGEVELLEDGEYIEAGKIIVVEAPDNLIKKVWNKELHIWKEGTTKEEFIEMRKNKILEYSKLEEDKKALENSKFSTLEEIELIVNKMQILEVEINNIAVVYQQ
jgi:hypothetical protein